MWTFVLTLGLLCWGSEAVVSCKNNLDASVDWWTYSKLNLAHFAAVRTVICDVSIKRFFSHFLLYPCLFNLRYIIYKTPRSQQLTGLDYIYMDSTGVIETTPNNKGINHPDGILANTLKPLFTSIRQMVRSKARWVRFYKTATKTMEAFGAKDKEFHH